MFPIARAYATEQQARSAIADLESEDVPASATSLFAPTSSADFSSGTDESSSPAAMRTGYTLRNMDEDHAQRIIDAAQAGHTIVAVQARFGESKKVIHILERHDPLALDLDPPSDESLPMWDEAAPLSSALMLPVKTKRRPDPALLSGVTFDGIPQLTSSNWSLFGDGVSRNNPAPLSSMVGMKPLVDYKAKEKTFGISLLKKGRRFLMTPSIIRDPAPFSKMLGLPTLIR